MSVLYKAVLSVVAHAAIVAALAADAAGQTTQLPGILQVEDFDRGNAGVVYSDTTPGNIGGKYRSTDVDIEATTDAGGGYNVGWVTAGEWLQYTVRVSSAAVYDFEVRVASKGLGGIFHIEVDGVDRTGPISIPQTGAWQNWTTIQKTGVTLKAGVQVWRLVMDKMGADAVGNINFIRVRYADANAAAVSNAPAVSNQPPVTNPPAVANPAVSIRPPIADPPAVANPPAIANPPPASNRPAVANPPPVSKPPAVSDPPVIVNRPAGADPTGEDIVLYSSDVTTSVGNWARISSSTAADGAEMRSNDFGLANPKQPLVARGDYFEARFIPEANRAYRVWLRLRALEDSKNNDSVWLQFSGAVGVDGAPLWRIGTTSALLVNLESCDGCNVSGWGWQNGAWWLAQDSIVRFPTSTEQAIRVQTREDGVAVDQILLSPTTYFDAPPGTSTNDTTVMRKKPGPANRPPSTSIMSPADGATYSTPATIQITASATDSNGTVARVEFYAGTQLIFADTATPWTVTWKNMPPGTYALTTVAVDETGASATSAPVNVTVGAVANRAPVATITTPPDGATYVAPASVIVSATALDSNGTVAMVEFYASNQLIGSDATAPYSVTWDNVLPGTYSLTAVARDNDGATGVSPAITVRVREAAPPPLFEPALAPSFAAR